MMQQSHYMIQILLRVLPLNHPRNRVHANAPSARQCAYDRQRGNATWKRDITNNDAALGYERVVKCNEYLRKLFHYARLIASAGAAAGCAAWDL